MPAQRCSVGRCHIHGARTQRANIESAGNASSVCFAVPVDGSTRAWWMSTLPFLVAWEGAAAYSRRDLAVISPRSIARISHLVDALRKRRVIRFHRSRQLVDDGRRIGAGLRLPRGKFGREDRLDLDVLELKVQLRDAREM